MKRPDEDFKAEVESHITLETDRLIADGVTPAAARDRAIKKFGGVISAQERFYETSRVLWLDHLGRDLRAAWRSAARQPLATALIVLSLAIGIGADTAVFSIANALLFRSPPGVRAPHELVDISRVEENNRFGVNEISLPDYSDLRTRTTTLHDVYAYEAVAEPISLVINGSAERSFGHTVTSNYFDVLGVRPAIGRLMTDTDRDRVAVLSHQFWVRRFERDPRVIGMAVLINTEPFTVIGIAAEEFRGTSLIATDVWIPVSRDQPETSYLNRRDLYWGLVRGRLKPGVSVAQAAAEIDAIGRALIREYPSVHRDNGLRVAPASYIPGNLSLPLGGALALATLFVSIVLAMASANLAAVVLARATARRREIAVRLAIGAGRAQLIRQLLIEVLLLFAVGALAGLIVARVMANTLLALLPAFPLPLDVTIPIDYRVVGFTSVITLIAAVASGLTPAWHACNVDPIAALKDSGVSTGRMRLRNGLVVVQITLSAVLLVSTGLFARAVRDAVVVDRGFDSAGVEIAEIDLGLAGYNDRTGPLVIHDLLRDLGALPRVEKAALAVGLPTGGRMRFGRLETPGAVDSDRRFSSLDGNIVSTNYFATLGIAIVAGRDFQPTDRDGGPRVAIVSVAAARRLWGEGSALGKTLLMTPFTLRRGQPTVEELTVVGVVEDTRQRSDEGERPMAYLPLEQHYAGRLNILVRTGDPAIAGSLRRAVTAIDANLPIITTRSLDEATALNQLPQRIGVFVSATLGVVGLVLAVVGLYGVTSYVVAARSRELGIRMALGAPPRGVFQLVIGQALRLIALGGILGVVGASATITVLRSVLPGLPAADALSFAVAALVIVVAGVSAAVGPARRATALDPVTTLRCD